MEFNITEVNAPLIMDVCKFTAYAMEPLTKEKIIECFKNKFDEAYVTRAIKAAIQLRLLAENNGFYSCSQLWREDIKKATREELKFQFRQALQDYPPFLVYADSVSKNYQTEAAANAVRGLFSISSSAAIVEKSMRLWGLYAGTIEQDPKTKRINLTIDTERLSAKYVEDLLKSLTSDFRSKIFVMDRLTNELYKYLVDKDINIQGLVDALREYEQKPDESIFNASKLFELFLFKMGEENNVNVSECKGIIELIETLRQKPPVILGNQRNICFGIGGIRNISDHGVDRETGKSWKINSDGALAAILMTPIVMRSIYLYNKKSAQEF